MFSRTPVEQHFLGSKQLLSPVYRQTSPDTSPPPPHHTLLGKVVAACVAMLDCLQRTLLGGVFLLIFFLFLSWCHSLKMTILSGGTAKPRYYKPHLQHLVVELGTRNCCPSLLELTWAESARSNVTRSKKGWIQNGILPSLLFLPYLYMEKIVRIVCYSKFSQGCYCYILVQTCFKPKKFSSVKAFAKEKK